jgi:hypothetical protein
MQDAVRLPDSSARSAAIATGDDTALRASRLRRGVESATIRRLPFDLMPRHASRNALVIILACIACAAGERRSTIAMPRIPKLRRFAGSMHGQTVAVHLCRHGAMLVGRDVATKSSGTGRDAGFLSLPGADEARRFGLRRANRIRKQDAECAGFGPGVKFQPSMTIS